MFATNRRTNKTTEEKSFKIGAYSGEGRKLSNNI
jgi:hypothetical protein